MLPCHVAMILYIKYQSDKGDVCQNVCITFSMKHFVEPLPCVCTAVSN